MAEEKNTKVEKEAKEAKKLDEFKKTDENKKAIAESEGKVVPKKKESKPAVAKKTSKKKEEVKVELEREYVVPLKKGVLKVPHYRRAKKAIRVLKEFIAKHMKVRDRDLRKVKVDIHLNNELWFRGIKKPANKIKVKAKKIGEIVYVELAEVPETVKFVMAREAKKKAVSEKAKVKKPKHEKEEAKTEDEKTEEKEDVKAVIEKSAEVSKAKARAEKHTTKGAHVKKTTPVKSNPKK